MRLALDFEPADNDTSFSEKLLNILIANRYTTLKTTFHTFHERNTAARHSADLAGSTLDLVPSTKWLASPNDIWSVCARDALTPTDQEDVYPPPRINFFKRFKFQRFDFHIVFGHSFHG